MVKLPAHALTVACSWMKAGEEGCRGATAFPVRATERPLYHLALQATASQPLHHRPSKQPHWWPPAHHLEVHRCPKSGVQKAETVVEEGAVQGEAHGAKPCRLPPVNPAAAAAGPAQLGCGITQAAEHGLTRCQSRGWLLLLLPPPLAVQVKGSLMLT